MSLTTHESLTRFGEWLIAHRKPVLLAITTTTLFFAFFAFRLNLVTRFDELLPQNHEFIETHNEYTPMFGGANTIMLMLEVRDGTIFTKETLTKIFEMTQRLDTVHGVDHDQILSLAHRTNRRVRMVSGGMTVVEPVMERPPKNEQEVELVRRIVYTSRNLYGVIVSLDEKATLMRATFIEGQLDHQRVFDEVLNGVVKPYEDENIRIHVAGEPWLYGWVYEYSKDVFPILLATVLLTWIFLYLYFHDIRGALRPTITGAISALWGLGFVRLIGFSLDPLTLVIPFFITARAVSHSVQMHDRYYEEYKRANWQKEPAIIAAFANLFVPTLSGIMTDALGLLVILLVPIVLLQKLAISAAVWVLAITVSELLLNPIVYYYLREPDVRVVEQREQGLFKRFIHAASNAILSPVGKAATVGGWVVVLVACVYFWQNLAIGDSQAQTPLLDRNSPYNKAHARIQEVFGGVEPLMVVVERKTETDVVVGEETLRTIEKFQRHMEQDPSIGISFSFLDVLAVVNGALHEGEPKWEVLPPTPRQVTMVFGAYFFGSSYKEADRLVHHDYKAAPIWFFCTDHKGDTIRRIIQRAKDFIEAHPMESAQFRLAGGLIGVLAAANQELLRNDILVNVLGFGVIFLVLAVTYRSLLAGLYMITPLLIANAVVNAYMGARDIGININTLPVVAVGVGFGIDYAFYIVSRIIEEYRTGTTLLPEAVRTAIDTSGKAVTFTAVTMILGTLFWTLSNIRFDAEMGLLLALWMGISFLATVTLLPVMVVLLQPRFILREKEK